MSNYERSNIVRRDIRPDPAQSKSYTVSVCSEQIEDWKGLQRLVVERLPSQAVLK